MNSRSNELADCVFNPDHGKSVTKQCRSCSVEYVSVDKLAAFYSLGFCPLCKTKYNDGVAAEQLKEKQDRLITQWNGICPKIFTETEKSKLPVAACYDVVLNWEYNRKGLILYGKTRLGKSRCAWALCQKMFMAGHSVEVMDSMSGFQYASAFMASSESVLNWIEQRSKCGLLFLDDVFKAKLTDSFEAALFAIIDSRMNSARPIITTLNDTGDTLASRMSVDRGAALIERLKESCNTICFK